MKPVVENSYATQIESVLKYQIAYVTVKQPHIM